MKQAHRSLFLEIFHIFRLQLKKNPTNSGVSLKGEQIHRDYYCVEVSFLVES